MVFESASLKKKKKEKGEDKEEREDRQERSSVYLNSAMKL